MQVGIYAIFDAKAQAYLQPFFAANNAIAFRNCERSCRNPESPFTQFPADFALYKIGDFDDLGGEIYRLTHHESLGNFYQFLPAAADTAA